MKKVGNILLSIVPFLMMFAVQFSISFVYALVYVILTGKMVEDLIPIVTISHLVTAIAAFLWYYFVFGKENKKNPLHVFRWKTWVIMIAFSVSLQALIQVAFIGLSAVAPTWIEAYSEAMEQSGLGELSLLSTIATLVLAPIGEELSFRGLTYQYLRRAGLGVVAANILQALLFGIMHMQPIQIVYASVLGLLLGYLREKYQSIYIPIVMHCIFNFIGTYGVSLLEDFEQSSSLVLILLGVSILLLILGIIMMKKDSKTVNVTQEEIISE